MAIAKCARCSATATVRRAETDCVITHGKSFTTRCKHEHVEPAIAKPDDCAAMVEALERARKRAPRKKVSAVTNPEVTPPATTELSSAR